MNFPIIISVESISLTKQEKKIKLSNNLNHFERDFESGSFKININKKSYTKVFDKFKKKISYH